MIRSVLSLFSFFVLTIPALFFTLVGKTRVRVRLAKFPISMAIGTGPLGSDLSHMNA